MRSLHDIRRMNDEAIAKHWDRVLEDSRQDDVIDYSENKLQKAAKRECIVGWLNSIKVVVFCYVGPVILVAAIIAAVLFGKN